MIRVAILGCGKIAAHHAQCILATPGLQLVGVCDSDVAKAKALSDELGVAWFQHSAVMIGNARPDVLVIATPSGLHFDHVREALEARLHVVVEKPAFLRLDAAEAAFDLAQSVERTIFPVVQHRWNYAPRRARELDLGEVRTVSLCMEWSRPQRYYDQAAWRGTWAMDGGVLANQAIHFLDLLRFVAGEVDTVCAQSATLGVQTEAPNTVMAAVTMESGAQGVISATTAGTRDVGVELEICGSKGSARLNGYAAENLVAAGANGYVIARESEDFTREPYGRGHALMWRAIAAQLAGGPAYPVDRHDCIATLKLIHALYRSAELGGALQVMGAECRRLGRGGA